MLGQWLSLWEAQSVDERLRRRGGGGIVTALLVHSMEKGEISNALVAGSSTRPPWAEAILATTPDEIRAAAGSKYQIVPQGRLVRQLDGDSAIVGTPCQIRAVWGRDLACKIGLFCGINLSWRAIEYLLRQMRISLEDIESVDYRAPGGGFLVRHRDGSVVRCGQYSWLAYFFSCGGCLRCTDHTNHLADMSVGDRRREWSSVIVRTDKGAEHFESAMEAGCITARRLSEGELLSGLGTPLVQKEMLGGYISDPLVRVRGRWIERVPLPVLRRIGYRIMRRHKKRARRVLESARTELSGSGPGSPGKSELYSQVESALHALEAWVRKRGYKGYDPYDVRGSALLLTLNESESRWARRFGGLLSGLCGRFPRLSRTLLRVRPHINPKAMGLFLSGYVRLAEVDDEPRWLESARHCASRLREHAVPGYQGLCWGVPFSWQSVICFRAGTPQTIITTTVANGFWDLYQSSKAPECLDVCRAVCEHLVSDLAVMLIRPGQVCFSYSPLDAFRVHNVNLCAAELLAKVGRECQNQQWMELAAQAAEYSLSEQNDDGSLYYWGTGPLGPPEHRDVYHSGFEIRALWSLWKTTGDELYRDAAAKYLDFYRSAYLRSDGAPTKMANQFDKPLFDIHGCAEAVFCLASVVGDFPEVGDDLDRTLTWSLENMQNPDGSWAYQIDHRGRIDRTPYMRWGQAWMFRALTEYLLAR